MCIFMYCTKGWLTTHSKSLFPCPLILCLAKLHTLSSFNFRLIQPHCALSIHSCSCFLSSSQVPLGDWTLVLQLCQLPEKKAMEPSQFTLTIDLLPSRACLLLYCNVMPSLRHSQTAWVFSVVSSSLQIGLTNNTVTHIWCSIDPSHISHWHYFMYKIKVLSTAIEEHVFILTYLLMGIFKCISVISRSVLCYFLTTTSFWCTFQVTKYKFYIIQCYVFLCIWNLYHIYTLNFYIVLCLNLYISLSFFPILHDR